MIGSPKTSPYRAEKIYKIDPDADTVIVLQNANAPIAVWDENQDGNNGRKTTHASVHNGSDSRDIEEDFAYAEDAHSNFYGENFEIVVGSDGNNSVQAMAPNEMKQVEGKSLSKEKPTRSYLQDGITQRFEGGIHYYVSSRHLKIVSPKFEAQLSGGRWAEAVRNNLDDRFYITAEEWDEIALLTLLDALHLQNGHAQPEMSLELLCHLAILVDYYQCAKAIQVYSKSWIDSVKKTHEIPTICDRDLVLWLCVAWVFDDPAIFHKVTKAAIRYSVGPFSSLELPISVQVENAINTRRKKAIERLARECFKLLDKYRSEVYECRIAPSASFECGSILCGALMRGMGTLGMLSGTKVLEGMSLSEAYKKVKTLKSPSWQDSPSAYHRRSREPHACNLSDGLAIAAKKLSSDVQGLELREMRP